MEIGGGDVCFLGNNKSQMDVYLCLYCFLGEGDESDPTFDDDEASFGIELHMERRMAQGNIMPCIGGIAVWLEYW